jgi:hypothetical protein
MGGVGRPAREVGIMVGGGKTKLDRFRATRNVGLSTYVRCKKRPEG